VTTILSVLVVVLLVGACIGAGSVVLVALGLGDHLARRERLPWAFAIGFGVFGWLIFLPAVGQVLNPSVLFAAVVICCAGLIAARRLVGPRQDAPVPIDAVGWTLWVLIAVVAVLDLGEGLAPPADGDSLAYHFALPKQFLAAGGLEFIPRAVDGATPMIVQMTYLPALALGGERGLTLWTMVSGWAAPVLTYVLCRRALGVNWSLAVALVLLTTPAVLYGGGTGQVEIRLALFALVAVFAAVGAMSTGMLSFAVLAGLGAGFMAAGKYTGLLFVAACGLVILFQRRGLVHGVVFGAAALAAGVQWYAWHWYSIGDPVFPMLFSLFGVDDPAVWNAAHDAYFRSSFFGSEVAVPANPWWFFAFPFKATLDAVPAFESRRTGLGVYVLVLLPFAVAGVWQYRRRLLQSPLLPVAAVILLFYGIWFFTASSQRVRHLLPIYPLLLILVTIAAAAWAQSRSRLMPLVAAVSLVVMVQTAGQAIAARNAVLHMVTGGDREAFLADNVHRYQIVPWINRNLGPDDRLIHGFRQLNYLFDVGYFFAHPSFQALVDVGPLPLPAARFLEQVRRLGISHMLSAPLADLAVLKTPASGLNAVARALHAAGCIEPGPVIEVSNRISRALPTIAISSERIQVLRLRSDGCRL
jgi:hypothetical protein